MVTLCAALAFGCSSGKKDAQYKTEKVDRGDITMTVSATGTLSAVTTVAVGSQVSGVISELSANFNSPVKKGQVLARLDPTPFQQTVDQRRADLDKVTVDAMNLKTVYDRQKSLSSNGLAAQADVDNARAAYQGALAQADQARSALAQAQTNLSYTTIRSPIDGVVIDRQYDVGQTVAASFQAPTLFSIAQDLRKMQVQADIDQSDIGRVQVGQAAHFTVDAYPDLQFFGRISEIRLNATVSQNVVTYPVIIAVNNDDLKLRPKETANVTIDVAQVHGVLRVPNAALRFKPDTASDASSTTTSGSTQPQSGGASPERTAAQSGQHQGGMAGAAAAFGGHQRGASKRNMQTVYVMGADKKLRQASIRTGVSDGHYTEIVSGDLKEGDTVVVGTATTKTEGPAAFGGAMGGRGPAGGGRGR